MYCNQYPCCEKAKKLESLVSELIKMFEIVEVSDSGNEFHPNVIRSCRVMDTEKIAGLIKEIKTFL